MVVVYFTFRFLWIYTLQICCEDLIKSCTSVLLILFVNYKPLYWDKCVRSVCFCFVFLIKNCTIRLINNSVLDHDTTENSLIHSIPIKLFIIQCVLFNCCTTLIIHCEQVNATTNTLYSVDPFAWSSRNMVSVYLKKKKRCIHTHRFILILTRCLPNKRDIRTILFYYFVWLPYFILH